MEKEDRKVTGGSLDYKAYLDHRVQLVNRELQELLGQVAREDLLVRLGLQERKDTSDSLDQWDHLERVELVEKSDRRDLLEIPVPPGPQGPLAPPQPPWMTCSARKITKTSVPHPLPSSVRTRPFRTTGPPPCSRLTRGSTPPSKRSAARSTACAARMGAESTQPGPART